MNMKKNPNIKELKELYSKHNDKAYDHVLWVSYDGEVDISNFQDQQEWTNWKRNPLGIVRYYYERYHRGNGYVGPDAANDDEFMNEVFSNLKVDWNRQAEGPVEIPGIC